MTAHVPNGADHAPDHASFDALAHDRDLARMANQIAAYFAAYPEAEAVAGVAGHIRDFWDPWMRRHLAAMMARGGDGLDPLARRGAEAALGLQPAG
jgi:formate dehydrogenase subunit delta